MKQCTRTRIRSQASAVMDSLRSFGVLFFVAVLGVICGVAPIDAEARADVPMRGAVLIADDEAEASDGDESASDDEEDLEDIWNDEAEPSDPKPAIKPVSDPSEDHADADASDADKPETDTPKKAKPPAKKPASKGPKTLPSPFARPRFGDWVAVSIVEGNRETQRKYMVQKIGRDEVRVDYTDYVRGGRVKPGRGKSYSRLDDVKGPGIGATGSADVTIDGESFACWVHESGEGETTRKEYYLKDRKDYPSAYVVAFLMQVEEGDRVERVVTSGNRNAVFKPKWETRRKKEDRGPVNPFRDDKTTSKLKKAERFFAEDFSRPKYDWGWCGAGIELIKKEGRKPGYLHMEEDRGFTIPGKERRASFTVELSHSASKGDAYLQVYEIYFRYVDDQNYYKLQVRADGKFRIGKRVEDKWTVLKGSDSGGYIDIPGYDDAADQERIGVEIKEGIINAFYGKRRIATVTDKDLRAGGLRFYTGANLSAKISKMSWVRINDK